MNECSFCGRSATLTKTSGGFSKTTYRIICKHCKIATDKVDYAPEAVKIWNNTIGRKL
ncbi:Lar family restriction alleviation protein [Orbus wheelerorum]|uniref:Lar family restriction alleviation protein n=1 Tax=Orbus wheelerorum TaxID=3074111 RepID=UPI00370DD7FA